MCLACSSADAMSSTGPPLHGATGTPVASARYFACTLSPSLRIAAGRRTDERHARSGRTARRTPASSETKPQPGPAGVDLARDHRAFQLGVIQVRAAQVALVPQQHALVRQPDEQRTALGSGVQGDDLDPVTELGVQLPDRPDQPDRRLAPVDHRNTRKHSRCSSICVVTVPGGAGPPVRFRVRAGRAPLQCGGHARPRVAAPMGRPPILVPPSARRFLRPTRAA